MLVRLVFIGIFLLSSLFGFSQNPLLKEISLDVHDKAIELVLSDIEEQGQFSFSYNSKLIGADETISIKVESKTVESVLNSMLGDELSYLHRGNYIIIQNRNPEGFEKTKMEFSGEIVDGATGERIPDANVYEVVKLKSTFTDENGDFNLEVANDYGYVDILISKENYLDTIIRVEANSNEPLYITLTRDIGNTYRKVEASVVSKLDSMEFIKTFWNKNIEKLKSIDLSEERQYQISLLPFIGTNGKMGGKISNKLSFNLLAGYAKGVHGFEMGGGLNLINDTVKGVQIGGVGNIVGGNVEGIQLGGAFNLNKSKFRGLQMAGIINLGSDSIRGAQFSGFINISPNFKGVQAAGFANVISHETKGVQISGFLNYTETLRGVQLGFLNITDTVKSGVPIGFFTYVRKGFHKFELEYQDSLRGSIAFKTGTYRLYNIFLGSYFHDSKDPLWSLGYGLGTQFNMGKRFYSNLELSAQSLQPIDRWESDLNLLANLNLNIGINIAKRFSINAGPVLNLYLKSTNTNAIAFGDSYQDLVFYDETQDDTHVKMWMGYRVGIRF